MKKIALTFLVIFGLVFALPAVNAMFDKGASAGFTIDEEKRQNDKDDKGSFKKELTCQNYDFSSTSTSSRQLIARVVLNLPAPHLDPASPPPNRSAVD